MFAEVSFGDCCLQYKSFFQRTPEQRDMMGRKCNRDKNDFPVFSRPARGLDIQSLFFFLHLYKPRLTWVSQNNCVDTCILDKEPSLLN